MPAAAIKSAPAAQADRRAVSDADARGCCERRGSSLAPPRSAIERPAGPAGDVPLHAPLQFAAVSPLPRAVVQASRGTPRAVALPAHASGLPAALRSHVEALSGFDLGDVRVHFDSAKPASLQALAYTQGSEIHVAPGQARHLAHEAWHVVQQKQGRVPPRWRLQGQPVNDDRELEHEAETMGTKLQALASAPSGDAPLRQGLVQRQPATAAIQRAIGLEIEVPVPVDDLKDPEADAIADDVAAVATAATPKEALDHKVAAFNQTRKVTYGTVRGSEHGFHVDVDHDARVKSPAPLNTGWPVREGGQDSIMEIVTEPAATLAEFNRTMDNVTRFVDRVKTQTAGLTTRWLDPFGNGINIGPLDFSAKGIANERRPNHNWQGSVQVNVGIDMREYGSLAKWYAKSSYAKATRAAPNEQAIYQRSKDNILAAVDAGRAVIATLMTGLSAQQKTAMGNLRGLRGWLTHLALYLLGGEGGVPGTTVKNITPILLKSPQDIAIHYGMTTAEETYYLDNRETILGHLIVQTGRTDLDATDPLTADVVKGKATHEVYREAKNKLDTGTLFAALGSTEQNAVIAYSTDLGSLSDSLDQVAYAGKPIAGAQPLGPLRSGNTAVRNIPSVKDDDDVDRRGGVVVEFRNLPGFHDGPAKWRTIGKDFLSAATRRNRRGGTTPK